MAEVYENVTFFLLIHIFSGILNIKFFPQQIHLKSRVINQRYPFLYAIRSKTKFFSPMLLKNIDFVAICFPGLPWIETSFGFTAIFTPKCPGWVWGSVQGWLIKCSSPVAVLTPCKPSSGQNVIKEDCIDRCILPESFHLINNICSRKLDCTLKALWLYCFLLFSWIQWILTGLTFGITNFINDKKNSDSFFE